MSASGLRNHEFFFLWGCILLEQALREPTGKKHCSLPVSLCSFSIPIPSLLPLGADVPLAAAVERFRIAIDRHRRVHNQTYVAAYLKLGKERDSDTEIGHRRGDNREKR